MSPGAGSSLTSTQSPTKLRETIAATATRGAAIARSMNFEPQLSRKGVPPPPIPIAIEVLVVDPTLLSSAELERLRSISADPAATAVPPKPFMVTLKGVFRTLGEVRVAIGAARRCDPDIVGLATDDGSPVEEGRSPLEGRRSGLAL